MAEVVISSGTFESFVGLDPTLELREFVDATYATPEGETVVGGSFDPSKCGKSTNQQYRSIPCTFNSTTGDVTHPDFTTDATEDGFPDTSTKTYILYSNAGVLIKKIYENLRIPANPTPTTLAEIQAYNINQYPFKACMLYLTSTYSGDMTAAIADIGLQERDLWITCPYAETINRTVPVNITIRLAGNGSIAVNASKTLTILSLADESMAPKQYFFGSGNVILGMNASNKIRGEWWCGRSAPGVDNTHGLIQAGLSAANQGTKHGSDIIKFGSGHWEWSEWVKPIGVKLQGAGMDPDAGSYSPFTFAGTVFKLYDETKAFLIKLPGGSRNDSIEECSLTTGNAPAAQCIYHTVTEYSDGIFGKNVSLQSTFVPASRDADDSPRSAWLATPLFEVHATAGQESIRQEFGGFWLQVPENGKGFYCDTPNTTVTFNNCKGQANKQATLLHMHNCGPILENNCDWEGIDDFTNLAHVLQRSITSASVVRIGGQAVPGIGQPFSTITLDPATPADHQFEPNDKGRSCRFGVAAGFTGTSFDAYIVRIDSPFVAILSFYPSAPITSQPCEIHTFTDYPNTAHAVRIASGNVVSWTANSSIDEGFNYSLIAGTGKFANFQFNNCTLQARCKPTDSCKIDINGGSLPAFAFEDALGFQALEVNINDVVFSNTYFGGQLFTLMPDVWRIQRFTSPGVSASYTPNVKGVFPVYDMFTDTYMFASSSRRLNQTLELSNDYGGGLTVAPLQSFSYERHQGASQKVMRQWGQKDPLTGKWIQRYDEYRSDLDGRTKEIGTQTGTRLIGRDFTNGDITALNFTGAVRTYPLVTAATATLDLSDPIARIINIATSADGTRFTGCYGGLTRDPSTGLPTIYQFNGQEQILVNNGAHTWYIRNEDTGETDVKQRWRTDTLGDLAVPVNGRVYIHYDLALLRWRASLLGAQFVDEVTLMPGATITVTCNVLAIRGLLTPGQDCTLNFAVPLFGASYDLYVISTATSRILTLGTNVTYNHGTLTTPASAGKICRIPFKAISGAWMEASPRDVFLP